MMNFPGRAGPPVDRMHEMMGKAGPLSTTERKVAEKQAKAAYGAELQAQMQAQQEAKRREKMERMGIQAQPAAGSAPGGMGAPYGSPLGGPGMAPGAPFDMGGMGGPPSPGGGYGGMPLPPPPGMGMDGYGPPRAYGMGGLGSFDGGMGHYGGHPGGPPAYGGPGAGSFSSNMPPPGPSFGGPPGGGPYGDGQPSMFGGPPPMYNGGNNSAPPPMYGAPPQGSYGGQGSFGGPYGGPPDGGGFGLGSPSGGPGAYGVPMMGGPGMQPPPPGMGMGGGGANFGGPPMGPPPGDAFMQKMEAQSKAANYRAELEAQIRSKEDRKRAEKMQNIEEDRARMAAATAYDAAQRMGGGGAPLRDPMGNLVSDLKGMRPGPGQMQPPMGGPPMGMVMPPPPMAPMGMGLPSPGAQGYGMGPGGPPGMPLMPPMPGGPGMGGMGPAGPGFDQGPNSQVGRFRSDNPYATPAEMDAKARQKMELQEALQRQIAEKKYKKDMEKMKELEEMQREEARFRADQERLKDPGGQDRKKEEGGGMTAEEKVAEAWRKAKEESDEAKRRQFAERRGARASSGFQPEDNGPPFGAPPPPAPSEPPAMPASPGGGRRMQEGLPPGPIPIPPPAPVVQHIPPPTPMVEEKARQVAEREVAKLRTELAAEAESLKRVVEEQSQQVAALQQHAMRMEQEAESAKQQVSKMRVDMIRGSVAVPESFMRIMSDYPPPAQDPLPPASMLDIGLDLPPPAAMQRRAVAAQQPIYDMGPVLPGVTTTQQVMDRAAVAAIQGVREDQLRPPTQGLRRIDPLEASMAAESMFIYPNGRELAKAAANQRSGLQAIGEEPGRQLDRPPISPGSAIPVIMKPAAPLQDRPPSSSSVLNLARRPSHTGTGAGLQPSSTAAPPRTPEAARRIQKEMEEKGLYPRASASGGGWPVDVEGLMRQNQDKLSVLQELSKLNATDSVEAIDAFLLRFSRAQLSAAERANTPAGLRVPSAGQGRPGAAQASSSGRPLSGTPPLPYRALSSNGSGAIAATALNGLGSKPVTPPGAPAGELGQGHGALAGTPRPRSQSTGRMLPSSAGRPDSVGSGALGAVAAALQRSSSSSSRAAGAKMQYAGAPEDALDREMQRVAPSLPGSRPATGQAGLPPDHNAAGSSGFVAGAGIASGAGGLARIGSAGRAGSRPPSGGSILAAVHGATGAGADRRSSATGTQTLVVSHSRPASSLQPRQLEASMQ